MIKKKIKFGGLIFKIILPCFSSGVKYFNQKDRISMGSFFILVIAS